MNIETIQRLNALNRAFYAAIADDFDQTRGTAWPGWQRLLPYLTRPISVLDVGCGNARFALFLHDNLSALPSAETAAVPALRYRGLDSSPALLARAQAALAARPGLHADLEQRDIIENPPDTGQYDLVALLGVLHHIPGCANRQSFLRQLAQRVKPGGLLVFTAWRFYEYDRFRQRIAPWPDDISVEPHDYLLDWRRGAVSLRYCHYTPDDEHDALVAASGLSEIATYRADGQDGTANRYSLLRAASS